VSLVLKRRNRVLFQNVISIFHNSQLCETRWKAEYPKSKSRWTRKPCYRKDDRAMRPIYGCPDKFRESLVTPTATFPEIVNGLLLWSIVWKCIQNLKFVALPVPGIIGVL